MSLVRPRSKEQASIPTMECTNTCSEGLTELEHTMFHQLAKDVEVAHEATKPLLSIFPRRGQVRFVILPGGCSRDVVYDFKRSMYHVSQLTADAKELDEASLRKVLARIHSVFGVRINELERKLEGPFAHYRYHIDLEAV